MTDKTENSLKAELEAECDLPRLEWIMDYSRGERTIVEYFKRYPWPLYWTLCPASGHARYMFFEFPLGSQYKCDVVILNAYSGAWEAFFIELESVDDTLFTKQRRTPTRTLATAMRQVDDWREYGSRNLDYLRSELVRWAKMRDQLNYSDGGEPSNFSGDLLSNPGTTILMKYLIIAGRSSRMTTEQRGLVGRLTSGHECQVVTYDRILHLARNRYGDNDDPKRWEVGPPL